MKKIIAILTICFFINTQGAFAFAPLAIPAWYWGASVALHVTGAAAGLYYAMRGTGSPSPAPSTVSSVGDLTRPSSVTWVDLTLPTPEVKEKNIKATMTHSKYKELAVKKDSSGADKYPALKATLKSTPPPLSKNSTVGSIGQAPNGSFYSVSISRTEYGNGYIPNGANISYDVEWIGGSWQQTFSGYYGITETSPSQYSAWQYVKGLMYNGTPPVYDSTPQQVAGQLANNFISGDVAPTYQTELDKMFQDPDYVPTFTDETGLPYAPPPSSEIATPDQLNAYNSKGALQDAQDAASASANQAAVTAQSAADAAKSVYISSGGTVTKGADGKYTTSGGDSALAQKFLDAQSAADGAAANAANAAAAGALLATSTANVVPSDGSGVALIGTTLVTRLQQLGSNISTKAPFSYLTSVGDTISGLYRPATSPSFDLPLGPWGGTLHISMAWADPLAVLTRFFTWLAFTLGAIWSFKGYWHRS